MSSHLVTGGDGIVGRSIARELLNRGSKVRILDLQNSWRHSSVETIIGDILDPGILESAFDGIDVVHHAAAAVPLTRSKSLFKKVNIEGTELVVRQSIKSRVSHINIISSSAVYGLISSAEMPISESHVPNPFEIYGISKLQAEIKALSLLNNQNKISYSILRPRTVIGADRVGILDLLFNWINNNRTVYLPGNGRNCVQFIHPTDLASLCLLAADRNQIGLFNAGTDRFEAMKPMIERLILSVGSRSKICCVPTKAVQSVLYLAEKLDLSPFSSWHYRTGHRDYHLDITSAQNLLGWQPKYSNAELLKEAYDSYILNLGKVNRTGSIHRQHLKRGFLRFFMD